MSALYGRKQAISLRIITSMRMAMDQMHTRLPDGLQRLLLLTQRITENGINNILNICSSL